MTVEEIGHLENKIVLHIHEKRPFGKEDKHHTIEIKDVSNLLRITEEEIAARTKNSEDDIFWTRVERVSVPDIGTIILFNEFDTDFDSSMHRVDSHRLAGGPYLLVEKISEAELSEIKEQINMRTLVLKNGSNGDLKKTLMIQIALPIAYDWRISVLGEGNSDPYPTIIESKGDNGEVKWATCNTFVKTEKRVNIIFDILRGDVHLYSKKTEIKI